MKFGYTPDMTPAAFIELAFEMSCKEVLEGVADGTIPATVANFSELHNYVDANCVGGFCDYELNPVFAAIFNREGKDDDEWFSNEFLDAARQVQTRVDVWVLDGGVLKAQIERHIGNGVSLASNETALLVKDALVVASSAATISQ